MQYIYCFIGSCTSEKTPDAEGIFVLFLRKASLIAYHVVQRQQEMAGNGRALWYSDRRSAHGMTLIAKSLLTPYRGDG
jgi:hypothetical protein